MAITPFACLSCAYEWSCGGYSLRRPHEGNLSKFKSRPRATTRVQALFKPLYSTRGAAPSFTKRGFGKILICLGNFPVVPSSNWSTLEGGGAGASGFLAGGCECWQPFTFAVGSGGVGWGVGWWVGGGGNPFACVAAALVRLLAGL